MKEIIKKGKLDNTGGQVILFKEGDLYHVFLQNTKTGWELDMVKTEELKIAKHSYNHVLDTNKLMGRTYANESK